MFDAMSQASLFGTGEVSFDATFDGLQRWVLDDTAWLDYADMWLSGDNALFETLTNEVEWAQPVVKMFDREVITPRLVGSVPRDAHPVIPRMIETLSERYGADLDRVSAGWYRDGNDSVAYHGDRIARERPEAIVATVSLGAPRRFLIRPKGGGQAHSFSLGHGDLVVMGGACQRTWEHAIPKTSTAGQRIALMFRHAYD